MTEADVGTADRNPLDAVPDLTGPYLEVMKNSLMGGSYRAPTPRRDDLRWCLYSPVKRLLDRYNVDIVRLVDRSKQDEGLDYSSDAETMMGRKRLDNLQFCITDVLRRGVPGDIIETGVWRGGGSIFARAVLRAYGDTTRTVWVADSFQGLPKPDTSQYPVDEGDRYWTMRGFAVSLDQVKANFDRYGLLDDQVQFLPGWFRDTLPTAPVERLAILRLDGDMYESTMEALRSLYSKVPVGGYVIVDDYGAMIGCQRAVNDFRAEHDISEPLNKIDWTGVFWQRGARRPTPDSPPGSSGVLAGGAQ